MTQLNILIKLLIKKNIKHLQKNKLMGALSFLGFAYLLFVLLTAGVVLSSLPNLEVFGYIVFGYFSIDLFVRFFFQKLKGESIAFETLPFKKSSIINSIILENIFNAFNIVPILLFSPIIIVQFENPSYYLLLLILIILFINGLMVSLKLIDNLLVTIPVLIALLIIYNSVFTYTTGLNEGSVVIRGGILFGIMLVNTLCYYNFFKLLRLKISCFTHKLTRSFFWKSKLSVWENLSSLEIKLIIRNRRAVTYLLLSLIFTFTFEYLIGFQSKTTTLLEVVYFSVLCINIPIAYGQYLFSWESSYFGFVLANTQNSAYISAKYKLLRTLLIINGACLIPLIFSPSFNYHYLFIWLFQLGIIPFLILTISLNNDQPLKLSKGAFLNYEGTSVNTFLLIAIAPLPTLTFYYPFHFFGHGHVSLYTMGGVGIILIILKDKIIKIISDSFRNKKYKMYRGFKFN